MRWNLFRSQRTNKAPRRPSDIRSHRPTLEALEDRRLPATFTWALSGSGDFNAAANWRDQNNNPGVPGANDDAVVPPSSTPITITSSSSNTVNSLLLNADATLTVAGGTFTVVDVGKNSFLNNLILDAGATLQASANSQANSGTLDIGGGTGAGALVVGAGAAINFTNNPNEFDVNAGSSFSGTGTVQVAGGLVRLNTNVTIPTSFAIQSGTVEGPGTVTIPGTFTWTGGSLDGHGTAVLPVGSTLNLVGTFPKFVTGGYVLNVAGTTNWSGTGELDGSPGSTINNSGQFNVQSDAVSGSGGAGGGLIFNNSGTFTKNGTAGTTSFQGNVFNNTGTVNVLSGTLSFTNTYTQTAGTTVLASGATLASSSAVSIGAGSSVSGPGTVSGNVTNAGILSTGSSPGTLTIAGTLAQTATGVVNVKIASPSSFDTIAVTGAAALAGTLNISLVNNFTPSAGQRYQVLTFASSSGDFATITGMAIPNTNLFLNPVIDPTDYTLSASASSPGSVQFASAAYSANDSTGMATIVVVRNNGSQGTVTVNYATSNGTAAAGVSYTATSGTLTFANGVSSQSFTIPILSTAAGKGNQTVNLMINSPTGGATLGSQTTAVLTLIDNTASTSTINGTVFQDINTNGVQDSGEPAIAGQMLYIDLDGSGVLKAGDPTATTDANGNYQFTGLGAGTYTIRPVLFGGVLVSAPASGANQVTVTSGMSVTGANFGEVPTSIAVPLTLPPSTPFLKQGNANADYVEALYRSILNRDADAGGLASWTNQLNSGKLTRLQVVQGLRQSPEHFTQEVTDFYMTILGRAPDSQGLQGWVQDLEGGLPEEQIAFDFLDSPEYLSKGDKNFVDQMYESILGRTFDAAGEANWLNTLGDDASGNATHTPTLTHEQVITSFLDSQESLTRLVEGFYQVYLQRLADSGGLSNWVAALQNGGSFLSIGQQFLASDEYYNRAAAEG
jgi:phage baseplate assembly protein gpV